MSFPQARAKAWGERSPVHRPPADRVSRAGVSKRPLNFEADVPRPGSSAPSRLGRSTPAEAPPEPDAPV
ncbi:hypothetical protein METY_1588 [Methylopila sp. Yamaguchi]|nr:hypothetical protein METY_1588 [Methylopila sp. Yamaguchi]